MVEELRPTTVDLLNVDLLEQFEAGQLPVVEQKEHS